MPMLANHSRRGFTLIELAIVLAVAGLLFVGLWRLMAGGNQQLRDQGSASQQSQLINAIKGYLNSSEGQTFMGTNNATANAVNLPLPTSNTSNANCKTVGDVTNPGLCDFLPAGFTTNTSNSYGQTYAVRVAGDGKGASTPPTTYSFMIMTSGGDTIPDTSGGRISSLIGNDGGFIYSTNVCGAPVNTTACGAFGAWSASVTGASPGYGFGAGVSGTVASRTYVSPEQSSQLQWLSRYNTLGIGFNTMQPGTNLFIGSNGLYMASSTAATTGGGSVFMQGGVLNLQGGLLESIIGGTSDTNGGGIVLRVANATANPAISTSTACTIAGFDASGNPVDASNNACNYAISSTSGNVTNILNVKSLYANTFIYQTSDIRLKTDIHPLVDPLADIMKLNPVSFTYKSNGDKGLGVIAQDVEKVYPQLVAGKGDQMKFVNYEGFIGPLIGAVQELKKENDDLRRQLHEQGLRQKALERALENREAR